MKLRFGWVAGEAWGTPPARLNPLTPREFEIFRLLARGQSLADGAGLLKHSPTTVSNHQTMIKDKLGVGTTAALVHLALRQGVIEPDGT